MRILLFEYFTGGWCQTAPPAHLYREGEAMIHALANDLNHLPDLEISILRDTRLPPPEFDAKIINITSPESCLEVLKKQLADCDFFWPVAPETNGILAQFCTLAEHYECLLLNSTAEAVRIAGDKLKTIDLLSQAGISCVETVLLGSTSELDYPVVVKPKDGVGCSGQYVVHSAAGCPDEVRDNPNYIVQPYLDGISGSLSIVCGGDRVQLLAVNRQNIERRGATLVLQGCDVNAGAYHEAFDVCDWSQLARSVCQAIPGLVSYIGVDFIVAEQEVFVLEVNPRLTSSYIGLAQATGLNPAALVFDLLASYKTDDIEVGYE